MPKTLYVSGRITGTQDYPQRFAVGCEEVRAMGYVAVSPLVNGSDPALSWHEYMKRDIRTLLACDGVYLLRGWQDSRGARLEKLIADGLDMLVVYQPAG